MGLINVLPKALTEKLDAIATDVQAKLRRIDPAVSEVPPLVAELRALVATGQQTADRAQAIAAHLETTVRRVTAALAGTPPAAGDRLAIIASKLSNEYLDDGSGFIQIPRGDVQWLIDEVSAARVQQQRVEATT